MESGAFQSIISMVEVHERKILFGLIAVIIVVGVMYSFLLGEQLRFGDEQAYAGFAHQLNNTGSYSIDGVHPTAYRPPGYSFFLAVFHFLGAEVIVYRIINFLLLGGSIFLLYLILKQFETNLAAIIGACLVLLYPVLFYTAGTLYPQTLGTFLLLVYIYLFIRSKLTVPTAILAGVTMGYLLLVIPTFICVLGVSIVFLLACRKEYLKTLLLILVVLVVLTPWTLRNYRVFNEFIPFSTNSGYNLLLGNSENTTPTSGVNIDISKYQAMVSGLDEVQTDKIFKSEAIKYALKNKIRIASLYILKTLNYFHYRNELATKEEGSLWKDLLMLFTYGPLLVLLVIRLCLVKYYPLSQIEQLFLFLYLSSAFFQAIFVTRIRYRFPFDFLLIAMDAIFLALILRSSSKHNPKIT